jgi:outer membrane protein OmpA-like peptidoglycan-associated protein
MAAAAALLLDRSWLVASAQAQNTDEKRKREQEKEKHAPPASRPHQTPPPRATEPPPAPPRAERPTPQYQKQLPPERPAQQFQKPLPSERPAQQFQRPPSEEPRPPRPAATPPPDLNKEGSRRFPPPPSNQGVAPPPSQGVPPPGFQKPPAMAKPPSGPAGPAAGAPPPPRAPFASQGTAVKRFEEVQKGRHERVEDGGRRKVIEEPGNRFIVKENNRAIIRHDETARFLGRPGAQSQRHPDGSVETFYVRPDGVRIVSVVDGHGRLLRRFRRDRDGREHSIIDNRRFYRNVAIGVGIGALGIVALNLLPPRVTIPYDRYVVDYDRASDDDLYDTLYAPPIEDLDRAYSLDEIRYNYELRARVRSIDIDTVNFEFGAWEVPPDQYDKLERAARAILRVLRDNPEAVFLIEGHTDAVGSDEDNLSLSDRRAQSVAEILTETYGVPPENLVTQGYGEQYLKVNTQGPEPRNRRVSIRNITGLMAER